MTIIGRYRGRHIRNGVVMGTHEGENIVTDQGKTDILKGYLGNAPVASLSWFFGIINNSPAPAVVAGDTNASHVGWVELSNYSGNRLQWTASTSTNKAIANSAPVVWTFTGAGTVGGFFVVDANTGAGNILFSEFLVAAAFTVQIGDTYEIDTYTVSIA